LEITEADGSDSEIEVMDEPLVHMRAAEMQLMAPYDIQCDFNRMLNTLVHLPPFPPRWGTHMHTWGVRFLQALSRMVGGS
jgi:hypothetical protein